MRENLTKYAFKIYLTFNSAGYGVLQVPAQPGDHDVECVIWKPQGTFTEQLVNYFLGTTSHLEHKDLVHTSEDRFDLFTETAGSVYFKLGVVTRGFCNKGVVFKGNVISN